MPFVVERVARAVFRVTGERPLAYLHDVLAQDVADLAPGRGAVSAVLTANGRIAAEVRVLPLGDAVLLDAEVDAREGILTHVVRHAGLAGCEVDDVSSSFVMAAVRGPDVPVGDEASFEREGDLLVVNVAWGGPGVDLLGSAAAVDAAAARLPGRRATAAEFEAARIAAGRPRFGPDLSEDLLVNETPLLARGVSMTKGCYPGQESVARLRNLGRVRRALRGLRSRSPLEDGVDVRADGAVVGRVTSTGGTVALALLKAEVDVGASVVVGPADAHVTELP